MPKMLKLKTTNKANVSNLTCRGIKSSRVKNSNTGEWGKSIKMEGDLGDLHCKRELLEKCIKTAGKIVKLEPELLDYVLKLLRVTMNNSYFKQSKGIFKH